MLVTLAASMVPLALVTVHTGPGWWCGPRHGSHGPWPASSDGPAGRSTYDTAMLQQNGGAAGDMDGMGDAITAVVAVAGVAVAFVVLRIEQARRRD